jgi:hypothetical protein
MSLGHATDTLTGTRNEKVAGQGCREVLPLSTVYYFLRRLL